MSNPWLLRFKPNSSAKKKVFCFHHAGGGATFYKSWVQHFSSEYELIAIQLPGRLSRFDEAPLNSIDSIVASVDIGINKEVDRPFVVIGNSFGAVVAFEWIRLLRKSGKALPVHFFPMSRSAPQLEILKPHLHLLGQDEFIQEMGRRYGGIPNELVNEPELLELLIPTLRADMMALETYRFRLEEKLTVPMTTLFGSVDSNTNKDKMDLWREQTSSHFESVEFPGGHFFSEGSESAVVSYILKKLVM